MNLTGSQYEPMVRECRDIYEKHGSVLPIQPDNEMQEHRKSENGQIEFVFYHDGLSSIYTPDGLIIPLGPRKAGNEKAAKQELIDRFGLKLITDKTMGPERWITYRVTKP